MEGTICFRCGRDLSATGSVFLAQLRETCFNFLFSDQREKLMECLDSVETPVAIVARDHTVLLCNSLLDERSNADGGKLRIGEILECLNAVLLGKCGETPGCFLCGVRKTIEYTITTGDKLSHYQTSLQKRSGANQTFILTTQRVGDAVLLLIETPSDGICS